MKNFFLIFVGVLAVKGNWFFSLHQAHLGVNILANSQRDFTITQSMRMSCFSFIKIKKVISLPWWSVPPPLQTQAASLLRKEVEIKCLDRLRVEWLNFWRGAERRERKKAIMHFCSSMHCEGGMKVERTTEKQPELYNSCMATRSSAPSPPQTLPDASRHLGVGCEPSHQREQTDALCSCCPFANSTPGGTKTQCISYTTLVVLELEYLTSFS